MYKAIIEKIREAGIAFDMEEYIEGIGAFAVSFNLNRGDLVAAKHPARTGKTENIPCLAS